jgi:hypothetical protein
VEFDGVVLSVSGRCPDLTLRVGSWKVVTDKSTKFKHGSCDDIDPGRSVHVKGVTDASGVVHATQIDRVKKEDDDAVQSVDRFG